MDLFTEDILFGYKLDQLSQLTISSLLGQKILEMQGNSIYKVFIDELLV